MNAHPTQTTETGRIDVSHHARLRVMQRLGVIESAAEHLRELLANADPVDHPNVTDAAARQVGDVVIVLDTNEDVVQTVFRDYEVSS